MDNILLEKVQEIVLTEAAKNNRISERALAERIGLSRTPIRESLQHLEEHGLIDRRHRAGIRLRKIPLGELLEIYDCAVSWKAWPAACWPNAGMKWSC